MMPSIYSGNKPFSECTRDAAGIQNCPRSLPFSMPTWLCGHSLGMWCCPPNQRCRGSGKSLNHGATAAEGVREDASGMYRPCMIEMHHMGHSEAHWSTHTPSQRAMKVLSRSCSHADCSECLHIWMPTAWRVHCVECSFREFIDGMMRNSPKPKLAFPK